MQGKGKKKRLAGSPEKTGVNSERLGRGIFKILEYSIKRAGIEEKGGKRGCFLLKVGGVKKSKNKNYR